MAGNPPFPYKTHEEAAIAHPHLRLNRLKEILTLRNQPWTESQFKSKEEREKTPPDPYTADELESVLQKLIAPHIAEALALSAACADLEIAKRLVEIHGPIPVDFVRKEKYQASLNGESMYLGNQPYLGNAKTTADMAKAIEWMPTVGLGWMLGVDSDHGELYSSSSLSKALAKTREVEFTGALPSIVGGQIEHPELLAALYAKKAASCVPKAYDQILCWVPEDLVAHFSDELFPYTSVQNIVFEDSYKRQGQDNAQAVRLVDVEKSTFADVKTAEDDRDHRLAFKDLLLCTVPSAAERDIVSELLLAHQATESIQHGFWKHPGMVLCRTSVEFLAEFDFGQPDPMNEHLAREYVHSYVPVDLMAMAYGNLEDVYQRSLVSKVGFGSLRERQSYSFNQLIKLLNTPEPLSSDVRGILSKDLVQFLLTLNKDAVQVETLPALYRDFGIDNRGLSLNVWSTHVDALYESGFKFAPGTVTDVKFLGGAAKEIEEQPNHVIFTYMDTNTPSDQAFQDMHTKAISMGLWTAQVKQPESVTEALAGLTRRKFHNGTNLVKGKLPYEANAPVWAYRGYLAVAGVEACALVAKSDAHWKVLGEVFDTDVLKPYLEQASLQAKGHLFMKDLGV
ncbi:hypothetical protein [Pseudomonas sp. PLMAX]|uniref:hypothetical protein n=1 Tax=Pseudomonas sp. PLMAX TaxID=2201998 RepID=UPI0038BE0238